MTLAEVATAAGAAIGTVLGVWNPYEQWREHRRKQEEAAPWAELKVDNEAAIGTDAKGQRSQTRQLELVFHNTLRYRIHVHEVELLQPKENATIFSHTDTPLDELQDGRKIPVGWVVMSSSEYEGKSSGKLMLLQPEEGWAKPREIVHFELVCRGVEASARRRKHSIRAHTITKFKS